MTIEEKPSILVSFAYAKGWKQFCELPNWREVVLDSGAFTVMRTGGTVDLVAFAEWALAEKARDKRVTEVFTLDVIGDWRASLANTERLWKMGVEAIPTYHVGEPADLLKSYARDYPKVALGGAVGYSAKMEWAALAFRDIWPKKVHGFGFNYEALRSLPFHSIDNSTWSISPSRWAIFQSFGSSRERAAELPMKTRGMAKIGLRSEVDHQLKSEARSRSWWRGRLPADFGDAPSIRLVHTGIAKEAFSFHGDYQAHRAEVEGRKRS